jgi:uncharacterized membrane protein
MRQLLELGWWFSFFGESAGWWLFCVVASVAALPLCLRLFRGMADRGAGLSLGLGVIFVNFVAWLLSLEPLTGDRRGALVRFILLAGASGLFGIAGLLRSRGYVGTRASQTVYVPAALCALIGILPIPHGAFGIWFALILVAVASAGCWWHDPSRLKRELRLVAVPLAAAQLIFLVAFLFFVNVRSYIPWATFELSLYQAEKWGNYTHLQSAMTTSHMPPKDLWFNLQPLNYYYGGHLLTATIAKATGTPARIAFNLGLATTFGLTMCMGFSFMLSLVHLTTRKLRLVGPVVWHSGMAWALLGCLAIGMFGNLDPWRQLLTRDLDWGVRQRWERNFRVEQEEWKLRTGIPASVAIGVYTTTAALPVFERPEGALNELRRARAEVSDVQARLTDLANQVSQVVKSGKDSPLLDSQLNGTLQSPQSDILFKLQNAESYDAVREKLFRLSADRQFDEIPAYLNGLASRQADPGGKIQATEEALSKSISEAVESPAVRNLLAMLQDEANDERIQRLLNAPRKDTEWRLETALAAKSFKQIGVVLGDFRQALTNNSQQVTEEDAPLANELAEAIKGYYVSPMALVEKSWGGLPPLNRGEPTIADLRFSWENVTFIDFWQPSRAIKGTPPGVTEPGTITEFPYFSAILGDHHPHHSAIPYTLAALCACLSLLRKNSRLRRGERDFWLRSWQDLLAMAFFIGAVFPVNIWDAVVLAPLYGVVVLVARRRVEPCTTWKWIGFAGWLVLGILAVGIPLNSMPETTPLFQRTPALALAILLLVAVYPVAAFVLGESRRLVLTGGIVGASLLIIFVGGLMSPGAGGEAVHRPVAVAIRDLMVFAVLASLAATWALRKPGATALWWYSAGAVYALVGGASLAVILPFKLYFHSPLQPSSQVFFDILPPFLSYELTSAAGQFWATFWKSSPVNPFPQDLRTELRDFIEHWGIFFIPILALTVARFSRAAKGKPGGFTFMVGMAVLAIMGFTRNYLGFWTGPISLGMLVLSFYYAMDFRRRAEGPVWAFLAVAFFWTWFVEALHFDDDYGGNLERYNTPFKIYYPIWAIFAGGMVVALREGLARFRIRYISPRQLLLTTEFWVFSVILGVFLPLLLQRIVPQGAAMTWFYGFWGPVLLVTIGCAITMGSPKPARFVEALAAGMSRVLARWPALIGALAVCILGMYYPLAATVTRTREFFSWPFAGMPESSVPHRRIYTERTLDAIAHLGEYPTYRQDYKALTWMERNIPKGTKILERAGENPYSSVGRISTGSGLPTIMGWKHHEHQWRGRAKAAPDDLKAQYADDVQNLQELGRLFVSVLPQIGEALPPSVERQLRFAGGKERLAILRGLFPKASLMEIYRLRRIVEQNDINMQLVADAMLAHVREMYTADDEARVRQLFERYKIGYVVVGDLERTEYGPMVADRFRNWKFEMVFDGSAKENLLPGEEEVPNPTFVFKVPSDFPTAEKASNE